MDPFLCNTSRDTAGAFLMLPTQLGKQSNFKTYLTFFLLASVKQNRPTTLFLVNIIFRFIYIYSLFELHPRGESDGKAHLHRARYAT